MLGMMIPPIRTVEKESLVDRTMTATLTQTLDAPFKLIVVESFIHKSNFRIKSHFKVIVDNNEVLTTRSLSKSVKVYNEQ